MIIIYSFRAANIQTFRKLSYLCTENLKIINKITTILALLTMVICGFAKTKTNESMVMYHKVQVEDCKVFYREAGVERQTRRPAAARFPFCQPHVPRTDAGVG